jgi:hypothetical protein
MPPKNKEKKVQNSHILYTQNWNENGFFSMLIMLVFERSESFNNLPFLVLQTLETTDVGF